MLKHILKEKWTHSKKMATYKSAPTFTMDKSDFESYREQVMKSIKAERMALMSDGRILLWIDEELDRFGAAKVEKDLNKKEDSKSNGK